MIFSFFSIFYFIVRQFNKLLFINPILKQSTILEKPNKSINYLFIAILKPKLLVIIKFSNFYSIGNINDIIIISPSDRKY